jgi:transcriptional regulator with GAF, ATPase, and Fis domain
MKTSGRDRAMSEEITSAREAALAHTLVTIADTLVSDFDVADLFDRLTNACVDLLGAATAGLMLADHHGNLQLMASSSEGMRELELYEMRHNEGPCLDCFAKHEPLAVDLRDDDALRRWPRFTPEALRMSFTGVQALPMRLRGDTIGALNIFHSEKSQFDEHSTELAQALADIATIAILQRRALSSTELLAEQLQRALNDRIVIEQAKGVLAERGRLEVDAAFALLRDYCRSARLPLTQTARELVAGRRDADEVLAHRWPRSPGPA